MGDTYGESLEYAHYKMRIRLDGGSVTSVTLFKGSLLQFDTSGLSYGDGKDEFMRVYDIPNRGEVVKKALPTGEYIAYYIQDGLVEITLNPMW